jgi:hypothetical protein
MTASHHPRALARAAAVLLLAAALAAGEPAWSERGSGILRWHGLVTLYRVTLRLDADHPRVDPLGRVARRLDFDFRRRVSAADLATATTAALGDGLPAQERARLQEPLGLLNRLYRDMDEGDRISFIYLPGQGTRVEVAGGQSDPIPGDDFARALFAIWLGDRALDPDLRSALLGRS